LVPLLFTFYIYIYIYSTNIGTEYFKHRIWSAFFSLPNAVCFIILTYLVPVLFTFYIYFIYIYIYIYIQQIYVLNILNTAYALRFFFSKCSLFHNSNVFGSCVIHILYTECAKIIKNQFRRQKAASTQHRQRCLRSFEQNPRWVVKQQNIVNFSVYPVFGNWSSPVAWQMKLVKAVLWGWAGIMPHFWHSPSQ